MSEQPLQLYMVMLGGSAPRATVELHDVVFAVGTDLKSLYGQLREAWFGDRAGLHIDAWQVIAGVDGWRVRLDEAAPDLASLRVSCANLPASMALARLTQHILPSASFTMVRPCMQTVRACPLDTRRIGVASGA